MVSLKSVLGSIFRVVREGSLNEFLDLKTIAGVWRQVASDFVLNLETVLRGRRVGRGVEMIFCRAQGTLCPTRKTTLDA